MESELTADVAGRTSNAAMLSEEVYLGQFGKDRLAAMSQEQLEQALARAKQRAIEFEETEKERLRRDEEEGSYYTHVSVSDRMCGWDVTFYEIEIGLRKRRALGENRLTLLKELRRVKRERSYDRDRFPDHREIILSELLSENGGPSLVDRRYSRELERSLKESERELPETLEQERLEREQAPDRRPEQ